VFTQCSNCHTVFQLSAEVLRAAGGQVRCGRCGEIFSALARLAEDANSFDTGESAYDMEERADSILESIVADQMAQALPDDPDEEDAGSSEIARLQVIDFTDEDLIEEDSIEEDSIEEEPEADDAAMEYTLPPTELDRIFIEPKIGMPPFPRADTASMSTGADAPPPVPSAPAPSAPLPSAPLPSAPLPSAPVSAPTIVSAPPMPAPPEAAEAEGPLPDIEVISDNATSYELLAPTQRSSRAFALWCVAAVMSALLLVGQVVHRNREALTAHGPLAPALRLLYSAIGTRLDGAPNLTVYQLRQWGVTGEPGAGQPGAGQPVAGTPSAGRPADGATLRVRASILNTSALLQPFPLLRLTLANRYGTTLGSRDFEPSEYMGKPIARALSPGETVDAILNILDPGKDAEGFEIDVCLRGAGQRIICANDAAAAQRKP
jgi:predicted Zn finger-like uncharacterized protein